MAKIIAIAHQKGGVGKSTIALNLAYMIQRHASVAVVDLDPQGTLSSLKDSLPEGSPHIIPNTVKARFVGEYFKDLDYDVLIIDTPPYNSSHMLELFNMCDIVIIPTKAGYPDVLAIARTVGFVNDAKHTNRKLQSGIVLNMVKPRSGLTENIKQELEQYNMPIFAEIGDRVSYARSVLMGGITKTGDKKATEEFTGFVNNVLEVL